MSSYGSEEQVKQLICEVGLRVYEKGFGAANDGNISAKSGDNEIWITPTGVSKGALKPEMLVKVNGNGEVLAGEMKPTSEMKMHLKVYEERPDIKAIVHSHPPYATAFAIAGIPLDQAILPESVVLLGTIPVAAYGTPSTDEIPEAIARYVANHRGLLLENHGALTWASDLYTAYYLMESLEFTAKINWITRQMNGVRELSTHRVSELVAIREKMGLSGAVPQGLPCAPGVDVRYPDEIKQTHVNVHEISEETLDLIVSKVTEAVLKLQQK